MNISSQKKSDTIDLRDSKKWNLTIKNTRLPWLKMCCLKRHRKKNICFTWKKGDISWEMESIGSDALRYHCCIIVADVYRSHREQASVWCRLSVNTGLSVLKARRLSTQESAICQHNPEHPNAWRYTKLLTGYANHIQTEIK